MCINSFIRIFCKMLVTLIFHPLITWSTISWLYNKFSIRFLSYLLRTYIMNCGWNKVCQLKFVKNKFFSWIYLRVKYITSGASDSIHSSFKVGTTSIIKTANTSRTYTRCIYISHQWRENNVWKSHTGGHMFYYKSIKSSNIILSQNSLTKFIFNIWPFIRCMNFLAK